MVSFVLLGRSFRNFILPHLLSGESLAILHNRSQLTGSQESKVLITNDTNLTHELHAIRAHLLHYQALLDDFRKTVTFIEQTPFPGLNDPVQYPPHSREVSQQLLKTESANLLREIQRLQDSKELQERRLKNVMNLVRAFFFTPSTFSDANETQAFSMVNIEDSRYTQKLTEASVRDSAGVFRFVLLRLPLIPHDNQP